MDSNIIPFFSIAIPTYGYNGKGTEFLEFSLDKISNQTFTDFEVVISDHSVDKTIENVCIRWSNNINLKYFRNEIGRGVISPNINVAMKNCKGSWIKILFQDDFLFNDKSLEIQKNFIEKTPKVHWFFSEFYHSNTGYDFYRHYIPQWTEDNWTGNNLLGCPSGLTLKNENIILFDEKLNWLMDCDYYKRMYTVYGKPLTLNEVTVVNRTWGERLTDTIDQKTKDIELEILTKKYA